MIERVFDIPFVADLASREKQIQQNYRPIIAVHKWFARRPGTLFRSLLLSEFAQDPLAASFYKANDLKGLRIADPFMGGGTPLLEALIETSPALTREWIFSLVRRVRPDYESFARSCVPLNKN